MKSSNNQDDLIQMGKVIGAHGIRGVVKVYAYVDVPADFDRYDEFILIGANGHRQNFEREWAKPHQKRIVRLALKNVSTREQAEALTGSLVMIPRKLLPPLEKDTFYWADLIGMEVQTLDGVALGRIKEIIPTGANDVYVVKTSPGHPVDEILLPAIASVILEIDVAANQMVVELPQGLI